MPVFIALLRAVNVGGTGKLPMKDLSAMCTKLGYANVRTYIASGNVVFESKLSEKSIKSQLELALTKALGKQADVIVRSASELRAVMEANPFKDAEQAKVGVYFQAEPVSKTQLSKVQSPTGEDVRLGKREFYILFPIGMGRSKLKLPAGVGTMRNMNTVAKLVDLAEE
ncbi:MAG TPA: DUF1697 domain-containing protein [Gemmatimonadaceae bacterium]|nr:DUF1697 domain-containing protein [Gemmatimonadaceae bacterium]